MLAARSLGNLGSVGVARKADRHRRVTSASRSGSVGRCRHPFPRRCPRHPPPRRRDLSTRWPRPFRPKNLLEMPPSTTRPAPSCRSRDLQEFQRSSRETSLSPPPPPTPGTLDIPAKSTTEDWVVSETTSPIDYSPLVTATIRARWSESDKDTPDSLIIRCRQSHVELLLRIAGAARVAPGSNIQVSYQLNNQSFVKQAWTASADGKSASYPDDAAALLSSIPDGARLTIDLFDSSGAGHDAMFQLTGLDAIRRKIETGMQIAVRQSFRAALNEAWPTRGASSSIRFPAIPSPARHLTGRGRLQIPG